MMPTATLSFLLGLTPPQNSKTAMQTHLMAPLTLVPSIPWSLPAGYLTVLASKSPLSQLTATRTWARTSCTSWQVHVGKLVLGLYQGTSSFCRWMHPTGTHPHCAPAPAVVCPPVAGCLMPRPANLSRTSTMTWRQNWMRQPLNFGWLLL